MFHWYIGLSRHFYVSKNEEIEAICKSNYLWWIAFLRLSKDYWWICREQGNCIDLRLKRLWELFGNIFEYDTFISWWNDRAALVFAETSCRPKVIDITIESQFLMIEKERHALFDIPLYMSNEDILKEVLDLLNQYNKTARQFNSTAKQSLLPINTKEKKQLPILYQIALIDKVVDYAKHDRILRDTKLGQMKSYEIGMSLNVSKSSQPARFDSLMTLTNKQNRVRSLVTQKKRQAEKIIMNIEAGLFPCKNKVKYCERWDVCQKKRLREAIHKGEWINENTIQREYDFLAPQLQLFRQNDLTHESMMATLRSFSQIST
jgi:hypothetical protein